jgi:hypothetical protein
MMSERAMWLVAGLGLAGGGLYLWKRQKAASTPAEPAKALPATIAPGKPTPTAKPAIVAKPGIYQTPPTQAPRSVAVQAAPRPIPKAPALRLSFTNLR